MIWSLQVLRFVAALMVAYLHCVFAAAHVTGGAGSIPIEMSIIGTSGVDIFFVLSGVVIATTAPGLSSAQFAWRRLRRIFPIYLICSAPFLVIAIWNGFGWRDGLATFLLWPATDVMTLPALQVGWTLAFEMLFYMGAALVLAHRRWLYVLLALYVAAFALRPVGPVFQFLGNPLVVEFLFGALIAIAPKKRIGLIGIPLGVAAFVLAGQLHLIPEGGIMDYVTGRDSLVRLFLLGFPAALIVYGTMQIKTKESVLTNLGGASYVLYLVHPTVVAVLVALCLYIPTHPDLLIVVGTLACVLVAWRVHELIEKPILRALPRNLLQPHGSVTPISV